MRLTKTVGISILGSIATLLFSNCANNIQTLQTTSEMQPLDGQLEVTEKNKITGLHYRVPIYSEAVPIVNVKSLHIVRNLSSGLLECKLNDLHLISDDKLGTISEANHKYNSTLTNIELKQVKTYPKSIPKRESKEFLALANVYTELARTGHMACIHPISKKEEKLEKERRAKQERINNDPRVIAARANERAAQANLEAAKYREEQQRKIDRQNAQVQQNIQNRNQETLQLMNNAQNMINNNTSTSRSKTIYMHQMGPNSYYVKPMN